MKEIELYRLSTGEKIVHVPETRSIVVRFNAPKKVLSTSLLNGGYREDIKGLFNYTCCGPGSCMSLEKYEEHLGKCAAVMGLDPARSTGIGTAARMVMGLDPAHSTGIGTAARMENAAIVEETYEELKVAACVTAGVEGNAGCAGDPAGYYGAGARPEIYRPGTINILLFINADMPPGILTRALVTCTEGKTAALRELMVGSRPATGTGTDSTIIVCDPKSPLYFRSAGKHNKLGELIGKTVKEAVKKALGNQNHLYPSTQHSVTERLRRYGVTEEVLYSYFREYKKDGIEEEWRHLWRKIDRGSEMVFISSFLAELLDEYRWGLAGNEEVSHMAKKLLQMTEEAYGIQSALVEMKSAEDIKDAFCRLAVQAAVKKNGI